MVTDGARGAREGAVERGRRRPQVRDLSGGYGCGGDCLGGKACLGAVTVFIGLRGRIVLDDVSLVVVLSPCRQAAERPRERAHAARGRDIVNQIPRSGSVLETGPGDGARGSCKRSGQGCPCRASINNGARGHTSCGRLAPGGSASGLVSFSVDAPEHRAFVLGFDSNSNTTINTC